MVTRSVRTNAADEQAENIMPLRTPLDGECIKRAR